MNLDPKKMSISRVEMTELVLPEHTNAMGTIFGGQIMAWVDIAAAICAFRHCRMPCVTVSMDALDFISPVKLGEIVILHANVNFVGKSSMEIGVKVTSENPLTGEKKHTASAYLTFVALDAEGRPTRQIPPVQPENDEERAWQEAARQRRAERLAQKQKKA